MPWFRVEDNLAMHQKTLVAGNAAMGMWVRAGSWSMQNLTDGHVPTGMVTVLGSVSLAKKLVTAGLWAEVPGGYQFHEWGQRQPTKARVEAERKAATARKEQWRRRRNGEGTP